MTIRESGTSTERLLIEAAALEAAALQGDATISPTSPVAPNANVDTMRDAFPGYQITRELHRGGQGVVYQAIHKGTKRKVAIKVMREGPFASQRERARFEREMQILAQLNDPHIVRIHDSNSVGGVSYYVMDYISGHALDFYMASHHWTVRETLRLFKKICEAVNAAHVRGVIHRDIKPSNIRIDAEGEPHILDFGLAKVVTGEFTGESQPRLMSITGEFIGSLPWASPEQAEGVASKIDIRTDVYSLGVVLFQMLTGSFPYPVVGTMRTVMESIQNSTPLRPHTIRKEIDDEVETIVLKCLAKERERRYQTSGELARDVGHYLDGEPIEAKRDRAGYVLKKTLRRYKAHVAIASAFVLLIIGFATTMSFMYALADTRRQREVAANSAKDRVLELFLEFLKVADPEAGGERDLTMREAMVRAAQNVEGKLQKEPPEIEVEVRLRLGKTFMKLGWYGEAKPQLKQALALAKSAPVADKPLVIELQSLLATTYPRLADENPGYLELAEEAEKEAMALRTELYGETSNEVSDSLNSLGYLRKEHGDSDGAERFYQFALKVRRAVAPNDLRRIAQSHNNLAGLYRDDGDFSRAAGEYETACRLFESTSGMQSSDVAKTLGSWGLCLMRMGNYSEAKSLLMKSVALKESLPSADDSIAYSLLWLAEWHTDGPHPDLGEAERLCRESLPYWKHKSGQKRYLGQALHLLGRIRLNQGAATEAEAHLRESAGLLKGVYRENHWQRAAAENSLGACLVQSNQIEEGQALLEDSFRRLRSAKGVPPLVLRKAEENLNAVLAGHAERKVPDQAKLPAQTSASPGILPHP